MSAYLVDCSRLRRAMRCEGFSMGRDRAPLMPVMRFHWSRRMSGPLFCCSWFLTQCLAMLSRAGHLWPDQVPRFRPNMPPRNDLPSHALHFSAQVCRELPATIPPEANRLNAHIEPSRKLGRPATNRDGTADLGKNFVVSVLSHAENSTIVDRILSTTVVVTRVFLI
jgi:hypothetical protein